jgi:hypothetical protein
MIGTTIIAENDCDRLASITCVDDLDELNCLYLDVLITLDFEMMLSDTDKRWADGQPIYYDPDDGLAIFKIDSDSLAEVLKIRDDLDEEQRSDLQKLANFVRDNPESDFYEVATF